MFGRIKITNFAKRHFDPKSGGTKITSQTPEQMEDYINSMVEAGGPLAKIMDGYAPFCKLIAIENVTNAKVGSMAIDMSNYQYIRHGYSARTPQELKILTRWFELPISAPRAKYLIFVVYSKEQLKKEHAADLEKKFKNWETSRNTTLSESEKNAMMELEGFKFELSTEDDWGVVAILGQTHSEEEPMAPVTMMRNALGIEEGGSGVSINKEAYERSVAFWSDNAVIKS
jgi:hypothetical protein